MLCVISYKCYFDEQSIITKYIMNIMKYCDKMIYKFLILYLDFLVFYILL